MRWVTMALQASSPEIEPGASLTASIAADGLELAANVGDVGLDALITSGVLEGVPILALLHGIYKTSKSVPALLYQRKVIRMLAAVANSSAAEQRMDFTRRLQDEGEAERLGETILLLLDKSDEIQKPALIGRVIAAYIRGDLDRSRAMRISAMINRAYYPDLLLLKSFRYGTGAPNQSIYATLAAVGFLNNAGFDGGLHGSRDPDLMGGDILEINEYGGALLQFGFEMAVDIAAEILAAEQT